MVDDPHSLLCVAHAEDEDVEDGGDEEDDKDTQGHHQGSLGQSHWIWWLAKLARVRIFNTEATPEDIENISEGRLRLGGDEDNVVHQALHSHVETVGVSQHLNLLNVQLADSFV